MFRAALPHGAGRVDVLGKGNPHRFDVEGCAAAKRADPDVAWDPPRDGKRITPGWPTGVSSRWTTAARSPCAVCCA